MLTNYDNDELDPEDILSAMGESLIETDAIYRVKQVIEPPLPVYESVKPPKDIFYRNVSLFSTTLPKPAPPKRCTCKYMCTGAVAKIKCLNCAVFDSTKLGYYCDLCFTSRHPWYRVPHIFTSIENDENIEHTLKLQHKAAQVSRYKQEGIDLMNKVKKNIKNLEIVGDDLDVDTKLRIAARKSIQLENQIHTIKKQIRNDVRKGGTRIPLDEDEAALKIQKIYKGFAIRRIISLWYADKFYKVWDPDYKLCKLTFIVIFALKNILLIFHFLIFRLLL